MITEMKLWTEILDSRPFIDKHQYCNMYGTKDKIYINNVKDLLLLSYHNYIPLVTQNEIKDMDDITNLKLLTNSNLLYYQLEKFRNLIAYSKSNEHLKDIFLMYDHPGTGYVRTYKHNSGLDFIDGINSLTFTLHVVFRLDNFHQVFWLTEKGIMGIIKMMSIVIHGSIFLLSLLVEKGPIGILI